MTSKKPVAYTKFRVTPLEHEFLNRMREWFTINSFINMIFSDTYHFDKVFYNPARSMRDIDAKQVKVRFKLESIDNYALFKNKLNVSDTQALRGMLHYLMKKETELGTDEFVSNFVCKKQKMLSIPLMSFTQGDLLNTLAKKEGKTIEVKAQELLVEKLEEIGGSLGW